MKTIFRKRLALAEHAIGRLPIPLDVQREAFAVFRETGELPVDRRLAQAVVDRVRRGFDAGHNDPADWGVGPDGQFNWGLALQRIREQPLRPKDEAMESLLNEAVNGPAMVRAAARFQLKAMASGGIDVTGAPFHGQDLELPEFGAVGMHLCGFPDLLAKPPYEEQARRLFARLDTLARKLHEHPTWRAALDDATQRFQELGERPASDLLTDVVFALGEMNALMRHAAGEDVTEIMTLFEEVARAPGVPEHEAAIGKLQAMAEAGLLRADADDQG